MPQPQSGISKRSLLLLGGLTALLASPSARAKIAGLVQDAASNAYTLLDETVAPAAQQAAHTVAARASELTEEARKVAVSAAASAQDNLPGLLADVREQAAVRGQQLFDSTSDLRGEIAHKAVDAAAAAVKTASSVQSSVQDRFSDVQQEAVKRRDALLSSASDAQDSLGHSLGSKALDLQKDAKKTWLNLLDSAQNETQDVRQSAQKKLASTKKDAQKKAKKQIKQKGKQVSKQAAKTAVKGRHALLSFADDAQGSVQARVQSAKDDARKAAEAQLKQLKKSTPKQLKKYEKRIALLNKELAKTADRHLKKAGLKKRRRSGSLVPVVLLVSGGVVLARVPAARQGILNAVGALSPEAEQWLRGAGRSVRNLIGTAWLERMEDVNHAPATAAPSPKPSEATGSAAGASIAPDAPAAAPAPAEPKTDTQKTDTAPADTSKDTKTN